jgi:hypothetical protein
MYFKINTNLYLLDDYKIITITVLNFLIILITIMLGINRKIIYFKF